MRTLLIGPDQTLNKELSGALANFPEIQIVRELGQYPSPDDFLRVIRSRRPDFVFISVEELAALEALAAAVDDRLPGLPLVSFGRATNLVELIPKLMHLGVREFLEAPISKDKLAAAIRSIASQLSRHPTPLVRMADVAAFLPAKPGVGATTIAISTSCALAHELGVRTVLLDCDLAAGTTKFLLKLADSASMVDAMERADNLDEDLWSQMVGKWDGLDVLHAGELDPPASFTESSLDRVLDLARAQYDTICVDLASSLDPFSVHILREARHILLVTTPEIVPLHMAADRLRRLNELGLGDKVSLLLNRKNPVRWGMPDSEVERLVGIRVAHSFANDYAQVQNSILEGTAVASRSTLGQSIVGLAHSLGPSGGRPTHARAEHRKFLEFFHVPDIADHDLPWRD